ncbi:MAG TPA: glutamine amidotransferase [Opitutaceae bacterium]|nr:glutamine amidotransferase [Opitutaceae bacterium]
MLLAALTFSGTNWLWPVAAFFVVSAGVLFWSYRATKNGGALRWVCLLLKAVGIAALAACLLEPLWTTQRARPGSNLFAIVADNSQGLQIKDRGDTRSRGEVLREILDPAKAHWQATLVDTFDVRKYFFDARLQSTEDFHELAFDGRSTALASSLKTLKERFQGRPLAGVLLFTDGNATDLRGPLPDLAGLPPIYPVVLGRREPVRDLSVQQINVSQTAFEDAPVSIQADVSAAGYRDGTVVARLIDRSGKVVQEQSSQARKDSDTLAFRFQLKPEQKGLGFYRVEIAERAGPLSEGKPDEATLANNHRVLVIDRGKGPYRVLYVAGRPNWEFKFLNRAIEADDQLQMVGLIRVAKREPKFDFRGRSGETSNPLYRGFGNQSAEEVQRYDQPVLVRLNTRDELELRSGFPRTPEDLYGYHAIVIDDLEAEFFAPEQATLVQKFVSERGGGLLMLGGMESFQEGSFARTPIGDMLPVYLDRAAQEESATGPLRFNLAREGWLQAWARLRDNEADERTRLEAMPPFQVLNRVRSLKPGASVIATMRDEHAAEVPALAMQRFGRGRSAALLVGDVWRWGMKDAAAHEDMDKAWRQLMRWLVADVPERVELTVEPQPEDASGAVRLLVRARDAKFQPLDDATIALDVEPVTFPEVADAVPARVRLQMEASPAEAGLYEATYVPRQTGGFKATAVVSNAAGAEAGRAEGGWSSDLAAEEFRSLAPNVSLLEAIAQKTGGEVIAASDLDNFASGLPARKAPVMETWLNPVWHTPVMFAFALGCLLTEWGLRRWKGMP